jgi:hypothetical protein
MQEAHNAVRYYRQQLKDHPEKVDFIMEELEQEVLALINAERQDIIDAHIDGQMRYGDMYRRSFAKEYIDERYG